MSRIFTINFSFREKTYTALVSCRSKECEPSYLIRYLDDDIKTLIPGNKLLVNLAEGIKHPKPSNKLAEDLVRKTTEAINGYLQLHEI
jgi:hypothetical protein